MAVVLPPHPRRLRLHPSRGRRLPARRVPGQPRLGKRPGAGGGGLCSAANHPHFDFGEQGGPHGIRCQQKANKLLRHFWIVLYQRTVPISAHRRFEITPLKCVRPMPLLGCGYQVVGTHPGMALTEPEAGYTAKVVHTTTLWQQKPFSGAIQQTTFPAHCAVQGGMGANIP